MTNQASESKTRHLIRQIRQHPFLALLLPALIVLAVIPFGGGAKTNVKPPQAPVYVEINEVRKGEMRQVGRYYGSLESPSQFTVSTQVGGVLEELLVDIGDKISDGQVVARLDSRTYELQVEKARQNVLIKQAQLDEARANLNLAQSDLNRQMSLSLKRIVPQSDLETYQNKFLQAQSKLAVAENERESAQTALKDAELTLSYAGVEARWPGGGNRYVGQRMIDAGSLVTANAPVVAVVELDSLTAAIEVIEKDYPKIAQGQQADVYVDAWPDQRFSGVISRIAPILSASTRQARVEVVIDNPDLRLKPGMFARVELTFERRANAVAVPVVALTRRADGFVVFEADPVTQTVHRVPVKVGFTEGGYVELLDTELSGPVVTLGHHLLEDGRSYLLPGQVPERPDKAQTALSWWGRLKQKVFSHDEPPSQADAPSSSNQPAGRAQGGAGSPPIPGAASGSAQAGRLTAEPAAGRVQL